METLYLTAEEQAQFQQLPDALREGWKVEAETSSAYETLEQITMRYHLADFSDVPYVDSLVKALAEGKDLASLNTDDIPLEVQKELYFTIGARGVKGMIGALLQEITTDEDMEALALLSNVRHQLLELNSSPVSA